MSGIAGNKMGGIMDGNQRDEMNSITSDGAGNMANQTEQQEIHMPITQPRISVITPLYNCASYVKDCIASLKRQTHGDFEAIMIDDGSTDDTLALAREATRDDERFSIIEMGANFGPGAARNRGLSRAKGEYLFFLDGDDYIIDDSFEKLYARAKAQNLDDLYFSAQSFYEDYTSYRQLTETFKQDASYEAVGSGREVFTFFEENKQYYPGATLRFVKRSFIEEFNISFNENIIHEDVWFTFLVLVNSRRASYLKEKLYRRRVHDYSITSRPKKSIEHVHGHFVCTQMMRDWMRAHVEEFDDAFLKAMTYRIADYEKRGFYYWFEDIGDSEKESYLASLSPLDRLDFMQSIVQRGALIYDAERLIRSSTTYRLGDTLIAVPRAIKEFLQMRKNRSKRAKS